LLFGFVETLLGRSGGFLLVSSSPILFEIRPTPAQVLRLFPLLPFRLTEVSLLCAAANM